MVNKVYDASIMALVQDVRENDKYPNVIVEILSESTAEIDPGLKKQIYQDTFRTPSYFWFDPKTLEFRGFHLVTTSEETAELEHQRAEQEHLISQINL